MSEKNRKEYGSFFDEYLSNEDPEIRKRADAWCVGIGLQAVDGLQVSEYLLQLARKNIEGELSIDEVNKLLKDYYDEKRKKKTARQEYETYTRIDEVPDPIAAKRGRPI